MESIALIAATPLCLALLSLLIPFARVTRILSATGAWLEMALLIFIFQPLLHGSQTHLAFVEPFAVDKLAAYFAILTTGVVASCLTHACVYFEAESESNIHHVKLFYASVNMFLLSMISVFMCDSFGFMWISIEATTLFSSPLVYFDRTKNSVEATWKYLIICSVGIAFALLGTAFIFASSQHGAIPHGSLTISLLIEHAAQLNYPLLKLGFIFCLVGYGTKAGIYPLHNWLPDAHSEAPAPASAMLSGALLNCALFGIWRASQLFVPSNRVFMGEMMVWMGVLSTLVASFFLIRQHSLKRMLAYSSIENVGIMLVAIGIGSGPLFFLQAINHSIAKASLFLVAGNVTQASGTKKLKGLHGLVESSPLWGILLALGTLAVTGAPPFGSFTSEMLILLATGNAASWGIAAGLMIAIAVSFIAICAHIGGILFGSPIPKFHAVQPIRASLIPAALLIFSLILGLLIRPEMLGALQ
jgi:hydrogenase-4 component F